MFVWVPNTLLFMWNLFIQQVHKSQKCRPHLLMKLFLQICRVFFQKTLLCHSKFRVALLYSEYIAILFKSSVKFNSKEIFIKKLVLLDFPVDYIEKMYQNIIQYLRDEVGDLNHPKRVE